MTTPSELRARAAELEQRVPPINAGPRTDDERMWLEKAAALRVEADEAEALDWQRTGRIQCADCGTSVRTQTLESLPEHRCTERQRARREREAADHRTEK
ncbi:hypothetical protein [Streptomyces longwoodensis]|uniref:hypothetical protein n=1 Tax=Streptomyces longwoodensis TaxID=68231 RepID=UPI00225BA6B9|nr:hypothetical protein [Streptomyces longwoodensis]MCX5000968.1 hypothetical protein [Streptomyces longwoodensis]